MRQIRDIPLEPLTTLENGTAKVALETDVCDAVELMITLGVQRLSVVDEQGRQLGSISGLVLMRELKKALDEV